MMTTIKKKLPLLLRSRKFYFFAIAFGLALIVPLFVTNTFQIHIFTLIVIFALYASSWNLLAFSGQGSLGHAAFLGIGSFASALIAISLGLPPLVSVVISSLFAAGIGFLVGLTCVRLKAWFLAMVTFGFSVIVAALVKEFDSVTNAIQGLRTPLLAESVPFYVLATSITALSILFMYLTMGSKIGLAFKAIRENESEARMIGINTARYKLLAFVLSTFFAGLAGGLYAYEPFLRNAQIAIFSAENSFKPLMMTVIGGLGTIEGPIIGSIIIVLIEYAISLPSVINGLQAIAGPMFPQVSKVGPPLSLLALGVFLVVIVIFAPKGVTSLLNKVYSYVHKIIQGRTKK